MPPVASVPPESVVWRPSCSVGGAAQLASWMILKNAGNDWISLVLHGHRPSAQHSQVDTGQPMLLPQKSDGSVTL